MAKKTFDKEQWLADTKVRVEKAKLALESGLAALQSSEDWRRTLQAMAALGPARLGRLSFRNALLVLLERPHTRHVATFGSWKKLGRSVAKGSKALTILQPRFAPKDSEAEGIGASDEPGQKLVGFKPLSVFALDQTEGPALPAPRVEQDLQTPEGFAWGVAQLQKVALGLPEVAGIELRARTVGDPDKARGWYTPTTKRIVGRPITFASSANCPVESGSIPVSKSTSVLAKSLKNSPAASGSKPISLSLARQSVSQPGVSR